MMGIMFKKRLLSLIFTVLTVLLFGQEQTIYRLNLVKSNEANLKALEALNGIAFNQFTTQNGVVLYFFEKNYSCVIEAEKSLDSLKHSRFPNSELRVFINGTIQSVPVGNELIVKAKLAYAKNLECTEEITDGSVKTNKELFFTEGIDVEDKNYQEVIYGDQDASKAHVPIEKKQLSDKQKAQRMKLMLMLQNENYKEENDSIKDLIKYDLKRNDLALPIYRIQIIDKEVGKLSSTQYNQIDSLVGAVKVFKSNSERIYTVHYFDNPLQITEELKEIRAHGFDAKLVGEYKGIIISERLTNLLLSAY